MGRPTLWVLDVGHGNAAVLIDDTVVVIDAGPGTTLLEFLSREGITKIGVVLMSHADEDHIKGLVSLLESETVAIETVRVNSDASKGSPTWNDLAYLLDEKNRTGKLRFEVGLTTSQTGKFNTAGIEIEVLAPSPGLAAKGPGSRDHKRRELTSNSMSAVVRLSKHGKPLVLLPGDIDETGLRNLVEMGQDISAPVAVFPHHGGGAANAHLERFSAEFCRATGARKLIFSIGRGRYATPRPEIIQAARKELPKVRILCTQLSENCASQLPETDPAHLSDRPARGREFRRCCAGSINVGLTGEQPKVLPLAHGHLEFIAKSAPSALCMKPRRD
jgi:competence protein ComEC